MILKYISTPPTLPTPQVPGWGGDRTDNKFQPWHLSQYNAAITGIELTYSFESKVFSKEAPSPFKQLSENFYMLEIEPMVVTPDGCNLLVLPHYRFYTDTAWQTPLPVMSSIGTDWWAGRMSIIFRYPPQGCETIFRNGEPFAQAYVVSRAEIKLVELSGSELDRKKGAKLYMEEHKEKFITREWVTSTGVIQDNLYNVLSELEQVNKLPSEIKCRPKKKVFQLK